MRTDAACPQTPAQPLPATALNYALAEPRIPLLGPRRVLPVDRAMAAFLFVLIGATCLWTGAPPHGDSLTPATFLVTIWGTGYVLIRIWNRRGVCPRLRSQLAAAALVCIAASVVTAWIYFDPRYSVRRTVVRPHPRSLYVAAAVAGLSLVWFAGIKWRVRRADPREGVPQRFERKEDP